MVRRKRTMRPGSPARQWLVGLVAGLVCAVGVGETGVAGSGRSAWIQVASRVSGLQGSEWRTDLGLRNVGSVQATVQVRFYPAGGGGPISQTTLVAAGAQSVLEDVVGQLGASGSGAVEVLSDQPVVVSSRTYNVISGDAVCTPGGTFGQFYPAHVLADGLAAGESAWLTHLAESARFRSNLTLTNMSAGTASVGVELFDGAGRGLADFVVELGPAAYHQETRVFRNRAGQTAMQRGSAQVTVTTGSGVIVSASMIDNTTNDPTTIPMVRFAVSDPDTPPGGDVTSPFPIDRGDDGPETPGTYKGLPLRLTQQGQIEVTPVDGIIGLVCIGMSNAAQECDTYRTLFAQSWSGEVNPMVRVVNCAVGGNAIERWNDPAFDSGLWGRCLQERLPAAGIRADQIRVIYHKAANQFTTSPGGVPLPLYPSLESDFFVFQRNLSVFAERVLTWFPRVVAVYTSSRSFGGFSSTPSRGEPLSYEEGHALNGWLASNPTVHGVWQGWGPYLWAPACTDGVVNGSGICYLRSDFVEDGVHPSAAGRQKVATLIHQRLLRESWYVPSRQ